MLQRVEDEAAPGRHPQIPAASEQAERMLLSEPGQAATLSIADGELLRDGRPHRILAGSLHYFRVHPDQWSDRLERIAELGLNTVDTYVPWNFHEQVEGEVRFDGWRDVERFITVAAQVGLDVIVRPGPFICAEWDNGGFPAWLSGRAGMRLRSTHPEYLDAVGRWFDALIPRIAAAQAGRGGPVVAVQVENEFGSFGDDQDYLHWVRDALVQRGITELLYTADGPTERMQNGGSVPGVLAAATFGSRPNDARALLRARRDGEPFLCAEFWNGWFDHWGENHHVRSPDSAADTVAGIVDARGSVSLYMAHGGTNFGLWAGANHDGSVLQPTVTSYDSDAPIAENGALTPKFFAVRELLWPDAFPIGAGVVAEPQALTPRALPVTRTGSLLPGLSASAAPVESERPLSFESLGQASGLLLYRATPVLPAGRSTLSVRGLHDRAIVFVDGERVGVIDTVDGELTVAGTGATARLELLVENQGRINYGPLIGQGKGILGDVFLGAEPVRGWQNFSLPIDLWSRERLRAAATQETAPRQQADATRQAGFASASLTIDAPDDTFLAFPGFGKGFVWVNDFLLGRYWEIGPQTTYYVPGPLLHAGENTITVLELEHLGNSVQLCASAQLGPTEEFIETFDDQPAEHTD